MYNPEQDNEATITNLGYALQNSVEDHLYELSRDEEYEEARMNAQDMMAEQIID